MTSDDAGDLDAGKLSPRAISRVGFLGISDYGLGQLEVLASRYKVDFATAKLRASGHAAHLESKLLNVCETHGIEFLGACDANSPEIVERARKTDLVHIGGYDAILKGPLLEAPRYGVLNTHLGILPLNRGCCPTMWGQLHGLPQGYTTYHVGVAIDHGAILDLYRADPELGDLSMTNREIYDALAQSAIEHFGAALDRFERGEPLVPCSGKEAYHRKGLPNDSWLSFYWSSKFLKRFSLALDFSPYLPGKACVEDEDDPVFLAVLDAEVNIGNEDNSVAKVGEVLESDADCIVVRTGEGQLRARVCEGKRPPKGAVLQSRGDVGPHPIDVHFAGDVLPLDRYLCRPACTS